MRSLFIGRWQPFHDGHKALIDKVLDEGKDILIACRETGINDKNPYTYEQRVDQIRKVYPDKERVQIMKIPDVEEVCFGRDVGWGVREIRLDKKTESISSTKIRKGI